jgi:hypothetical protein
VPCRNKRPCRNKTPAINLLNMCTTRLLASGTGPMIGRVDSVPSCSTERKREDLTTNPMKSSQPRDNQESAGASGHESSTAHRSPGPSKTVKLTEGLAHHPHLKQTRSNQTRPSAIHQAATGTHHCPSQPDLDAKCKTRTTQTKAHAGKREDHPSTTYQREEGEAMHKKIANMGIGPTHLRTEKARGRQTVHRKCYLA